MIAPPGMEAVVSLSAASFLKHAARIGVTRGCVAHVAVQIGIAGIIAQRILTDPPSRGAVVIPAPVVLQLARRIVFTTGVLPAVADARIGFIGDVTEAGALVYWLPGFYCCC